MHYSVYVGLAFAALFGVVAPVIARRTSPAIAAWLLSVGGVISALSGVGALNARREPGGRDTSANRFWISRLRSWNFLLEAVKHIAFT